MSTDQIPTRRILSRNKIPEEESPRQNRLNIKTEIKNIANKSPGVISNKTDNQENDTSMTTTAHTQQQQHNLIVNYMNKEPFNEDIQIEESNLIHDLKWRSNVIDQLKEKIKQIRMLQADSKATKPMLTMAYRQGLLLCSSIKKLNRVANMRVNKARNLTHEEKNKIDEHHLELQNLLYEISHLQVEINKCLEFRSLDEDINLVDVENFHKNAPADISLPVKDFTLTPSESSENAHKLKLARLDWELIERQNMLGRIKDLEKQIELRERELNEKQNKLESLNPKLNAILDACKPTLEYFNTTFTENTVFCEQVQYLPKPLYQFYMMMTSYRDTIDNTIEIEVNGDLEEAKRFDTNDSISFEDEDSDSNDEETDNDYKKKKSKSKASKKKANDREKLFNTFPLTCKLKININGYGQLSLEFIYLNFLKIVAVKIETSFSKDSMLGDTSMLKAENMFNLLYPNDNGLESPNLANKFLLSNSGIKSIDQYMGSIGIPYRWCQILCGLYYGTKNESKLNQEGQYDFQDKFQMNKEKVNGKAEKVEECEMIEVDNDLSDVDNEEEDLNKNMDDLDLIDLKNHNESKFIIQILNRLKSRFKSRIILQRTINSKKNPSSTDNQRLRIQSSIVSFKESTYEKFLSCSYTQHLLGANIQINETECTFYEVILLNGEAKLQAQVVIAQDYPKTAPLFAINVDWKHERNFKNDESIRDIERELNVFREKFLTKDQCGGKNLRRSLSRISVEEKHYDLFEQQINHLLICFDIYLESESYYLEDNEYQRNKLFPQAVRGRDRKRPFSYIANKDIFVQRMSFA